MKHLFLVSFVSLAFSGSVFSQSPDGVAPDIPVIVYDQPVIVPDCSVTEFSDRFASPWELRFAQEFQEADSEFTRIFYSKKTIIMIYANNFEKALDVLTRGGTVKRQCMGENVFIFKQVPSTIDKLLIPRMTSLPDSAKREFARRCNDKYLQLDGDIHYTDQLAIVDSSNVIRGYNPSVEDVFACDWVVLDEMC